MAVSVIQKYSDIKYQPFSVTGTTGTTSIGGGWYKGLAQLPTVDGSTIGIVLSSVMDTTYADTSVFAVPYNKTHLTVLTTSANRGLKADGVILYI